MSDKGKLFAIAGQPGVFRRVDADGETRRERAELLPDMAIEGRRTDWVQEGRSLDGTLTRWRTEILKHHHTGASNGPTEGLSLLASEPAFPTRIRSARYVSSTGQAGRSARDRVRSCGATSKLRGMRLTAAVTHDPPLVRGALPRGRGRQPGSERGRGLGEPP